MKILAFRMAELTKMVEKFNKKATKWNLPLVTLEEVERGVEEREIVVGTDDEGRAMFSDVKVEYVKINLQGETPRLAGWSIHSKIQPSEVAGQNFVFTTMHHAPLELLRTKTLYCDHCQTRRLKKNAYWIEHEDGRQMMVGATCLKDFLPAVDVDSLIGYMNQLAELQDSDEWDSIYGCPQDYWLYSTDEAIMDSYVSIKKLGYTSKAKAEEDFTRTATAHNINPSRKMRAELYKDIDIDALKLELEGFKDHVMAKSPVGNDFIYNVQLTLQSEFIRPKLYGYLAAAVNMWIKDMAEAREKAAGKPSEWVGKVGEMRDFRDLTVTRVTPSEGYYGTTYWYGFLDSEGNQLTWGASRHIEKQPGEKVSLRAKIKEHSEFRGTKQTVITRGSVIQ